VYFTAGTVCGERAAMLTSATADFGAAAATAAEAAAAAARMRVVGWWIMHVFVLLVAVVPPLIHPHWLLVTLPSLSCMLVYIACFAASRLLHASRREVAQREDFTVSELHAPPASRATGTTGTSSSSRRSSTFSMAIDEQPSERPADVKMTIVVVMVDKLDAALRERGAEAVLTSLFKGEAPELKATVAAASAAFALISYRQERIKPDDGTTMDCEALLSIVAKAQAAGVASLWLDCWCYRSTGEYDHADFCRTLGLVTKFANSVVWLPHARRGAPSSYQFRCNAARPDALAPATAECACGLRQCGAPSRPPWLPSARSECTSRAWAFLERSAGWLGSDLCSPQCRASNLLRRFESW